MDHESMILRIRLLLCFLRLIFNLKKIESSYYGKEETLRNKYAFQRCKLLNRIKRAKTRQQRMRRRRVFVMLILLTQSTNITRRIHRRIWNIPRNSDLWQDVNLWSDAEWLRNVRMSRNTFEYLCNELGPDLQKQRTKFRYKIVDFKIC